MFQDHARLMLMLGFGSWKTWLLFDCPLWRSAFCDGKQENRMEHRQHHLDQIEERRMDFGWNGNQRVELGHSSTHFAVLILGSAAAVEGSVGRWKVRLVEWLEAGQQC